MTLKNEIRIFTWHLSLFLCLFQSFDSMSQNPIEILNKYRYAWVIHPPSLGEGPWTTLEDFLHGKGVLILKNINENDREDTQDTNENPCLVARWVMVRELVNNKNSGNVYNIIIKVYDCSTNVVFE